MLEGRHCDQRHRRLSAWDRRRKGKGKIQSETKSTGRVGLQQRPVEEHAGSIYPVIS